MHLGVVQMSDDDEEDDEEDDEAPVKHSRRLPSLVSLDPAKIRIKILRTLVRSMIMVFTGFFAVVLLFTTVFYN